MITISPCDLGKVTFASHVQYAITPVMQEDSIDGKIRRVKDLTLFFVALVMVLSAFIYCVTILNQNPNNEWAMVIASSIISALLGFLTGRKIH